MLDETESRKAFQPAFFRKFDDRVTKSSPNLTKFRSHDHKRLVNTSTEGIDELLHGLREIDEILSKIGVFSRTPKLQSKETHDSGGFSTWLDDLNHYKESRKHQESSHQLVLMNLQKKIEIQSKRGTR